MSQKSDLLLKAGGFAGALIALTTIGNYLVSAAPWETKIDFASVEATHDIKEEKLNEHIDKLQAQAERDGQQLMLSDRAYWIGQKEQAEDDLKKSPGSESARHLLDLSNGQIADMDRRLQGKEQ